MKITDARVIDPKSNEIKSTSLRDVRIILLY
jgi:hypothetical protein